METADAVPILMYHSVGRPLPGWKTPWFTLPVEIFEDHLRHLAAAGFRSVGLDDVYDHVSGERVLPRNSVCLTFDDGYLDNWVYVVPLLKRHGFTGTVFVTPEFVDPRDVVRETITDPGFDSVRAAPSASGGFMSWAELRRAGDVLSVQPHGLTHTQYPTGPEIIDYHHPGDGHAWLEWNVDPESKPFYIERLGESRVRWGTPVYVHGKSLEVTRFFPDPEESNALTAFVEQHGGASFFRRADWRAMLDAEAEKCRGGGQGRGRHETPEERRARYETELRESRRRVEEGVGGETEYFVFPGGGYNAESFELARSIYKSVAVKSPDKERLRNRPGEDPRCFSRRGTQLIGCGERARYTGGRYLVEFLREYRGSRVARRRRQAMKLCHLAALKIAYWR